MQRNAFGRGCPREQPEDAVVLGIEGLPPEDAAWRLITASWISHTVRAMAVLGVADHLAAGPLSAEELAAAIGADRVATASLLRALAGLGICAHDAAGRARLTPLGDLFRADAPDSFRADALTMPAPYMERAWHELPEAIRTGRAVFPRVHGVGFWEYLGTHPEDGAAFDAAMTAGAEGRARALLAARDLSGIGVLVDVGGGEGRLLAVALAAHPRLRGIVVDRPEVMPRAEAFLAAAGARNRCEPVAADILAEVPPGGDAYVLAQIIHDWPDEEALAILRACHAAMAPGARIWLVEQVIEPGDDFAGAKLLGLLMLVLFGARERTGAEYGALLTEAGFAEVAVYPGEPPWSVVEGVRR